MQGSSRGRWEDDADTLHYEFTANDPESFAGPLNGDVPHHPCRRPGLRERLPRGQLQHAAHPARRAPRKAGLQTAIRTTAFYGHGLGLYGSVDRVGQLAIAP